MQDGSVISVKKMEDNLPEKQFGNEVSNLIAIRHENIMKLIGFCYEPRKKVIEHNGRHIIVDVLESYLCYEYARNGSLGKYISGMSMHYWIDILVILISSVYHFNFFAMKHSGKRKKCC